MAEFLTGMKRTNMCGEVSSAQVGQTVTVMGWTNRRRDLGGLIFVQLRDRTGIVQVVFDSTRVDKNVFDKASSIRLEFVIAVRGVVKQRDANNINPNMKTGEIEIDVTDLKILSEAETTPFSIGDTRVDESLRLKYRYLDLRREDLQQNLIVRSQIAQSTRKFLSSHGFLEIETPFLGKSTPEGARDYLVPSRVQAGKYYALPQSPQLYKQLLMIGGFDRYFQIAKCFRDEDLRANRQPEFTQIDIEMSFVDKEDDVLELIEDMISTVFWDVKQIKLETPFKRITYKHAMERFGSDKPDLRFGLELIDLSSVVKDCGFSVFESALSNVEKSGSVRAVNLKGLESKVSRKDFDKLVDFVKTYRAKGLASVSKNNDGLTKCSFAKFVTNETIEAICNAAAVENGDLLLVVADGNNEIVCNALGALRCELAEKYDLIDKSLFEIVWITEFPLLEYDEEENRFVAKHHPFTSPKNEDIGLMKTEPQKVRAKAYDLVINGQEAGGGSLRIYNKEIQKLMFETLGFTDEKIAEKFGYFINAFNFGTPPHGGIAFGLDRLTMLLTKTDSIKEVVAFPKVQNASCLMSEAPNVVEEKQLKELSIKFNKYE